MRTGGVEDTGHVVDRPICAGIVGHDRVVQGNHCVVAVGAKDPAAAAPGTIVGNRGVQQGHATAIDIDPAAGLLGRVAGDGRVDHYGRFAIVADTTVRDGRIFYVRGG